jgi:hypothetical protein
MPELETQEGFSMSWIMLGAVILRGVLTIPMVNKAIDNFTAGTSNKVDDWVWKAVQEVLRMEITPDRAVASLKKKLDDQQRAYDSLSLYEKWEAKQPRMVWGEYPEGRFKLKEGGAV